MKQTQLIDQLSASLRPVKRLLPPYLRFALWICASVAFVFGCVWWSGFASNLSEMFSSVWLLSETGFVLLAAAGAGLLGFYLSVPGRFEKWMLAWVGLPLTIWLTLLGWRLISYVAEHSVSVLGMVMGWPCTETLLVLGAGPVAALVWMIRKGAPMRRRKTGFLIFSASFLLAGFGLQFMCTMLASPVHVFYLHVLPILLMTGLGLWIGKLLLKKKV